MEVDWYAFSNVIRSISYMVGAPVSITLAFIMMNDHSRYTALFFFTNGLLNLVWLVSLVIAVGGYDDTEWRSVAMPIVVANTTFLCLVLAIRLRSKSDNAMRLQ